MGQEVREVAILGGGPAGMTAGLYLCRSNIDVVLLEKQLPGGQVAWSPLIENYPGFPDGIEGPDLVELIKAQIERFGLEIKSFAEVVGLTPEEDYKLIKLEKEEVKALSVIIATGRTPKKLGIPGEDEYTGRGISYCATCDGPLFKDKVVLVVGGGDAAVQEALHLTRFTSKVLLVHRRDELRASSYLQERAFSNPKLEILWNSEIAEVRGNDTVNSVSVVNNQTGEQASIDVSGVFFYVGNIPNTAFLAEEIELDDSGYVVTDDTLETSVPGIFAAGDARANRFKQIVTSAAEGALAAYSAERHLENIGVRDAYPGGT